MTIAFFDFDGTIIQSDSLKRFLLFYFNPLQLIAKSLRYSPYLLKYSLGIIDNSTAKEKLFFTFFKGHSISAFNHKCKDFVTFYLSQKIREQANEKIHWHLGRGDEVVVVSASIQNYLLPLFERHKIKVIATKLQVKEQRLTGFFSTPNCYGIEKKKRVLEEYDLSVYEDVYVYGDSKGDENLFELASKKFYKNFG